MRGNLLENQNAPKISGDQAQDAGPARLKEGAGLRDLAIESGILFETRLILKPRTVVLARLWDPAGDSGRDGTEADLACALLKYGAARFGAGCARGEGAVHTTLSITRQNVCACQWPRGTNFA